MLNDFKAETSVNDPRLGQFFPKELDGIEDKEFVEFSKKCFVDVLNDIDSDYVERLFSIEHYEEERDVLDYHTGKHCSYYSVQMFEFYRNVCDFLNEKYKNKFLKHGCVYENISGGCVAEWNTDDYNQWFSINEVCKNRGCMADDFYAVLDSYGRCDIKIPSSNPDEFKDFNVIKTITPQMFKDYFDFLILNRKLETFENEYLVECFKNRLYELEDCEEDWSDKDDFLKEHKRISELIKKYSEN